MITTKNRYLNRLLKLTRHLAKMQLTQMLSHDTYVYPASATDTTVAHTSIIIAEFPEVFKDWAYRYRDATSFWQKNEKLNSLAAAAVYLNLTGDELFHLFVPDYQDSTFKGRVLSDSYTLYEVVHNLYQFILFKANKLKKTELQLDLEVESEFEVLYKSLPLNIKRNYVYPENHMSALSA